MGPGADVSQFYLVVVDSAECTVQQGSFGMSALWSRLHSSPSGPPISLKESSERRCSEACQEKAVLGREHPEPPHKMAQMSCQLVADPRLCCPLQGTRVPIWKRERGRVGIFHPRPRVTQKRAKPVPSLLYSVIFLTEPRRAKAGRDLSAPLPCLVPRSHNLLPFASPELPGKVVSLFSFCFT